MRHILSWSGGKDSTAAIIYCHENGIPLDEIIFCEVMYSIKRGISGENPLHLEFIYRAKELFESWGYKVTILRSDRDFLYCFNHIIEKAPKNPHHVGKRYGFPLLGRCVIQRDCKLRPMKQYLRQLDFMDGYVNYVGICADEPDRLEALHKKPNSRSILAENGITQEMARQMCESYDLLSPTYEFSKRGGCWFCFASKIFENAAIKQTIPGVWDEFVKLENEKGLAHSRWNVFLESLAERNRQVDEFLLDTV